MNNSRVGTRAKHVPRELWWRQAMGRLVDHGFTKKTLVDLSKKGRLDLVSNEHKAMSIADMLEMGLPVDQLHTLRQEIDPSLYSEAFRAGIHPAELNDVADSSKLKTVKDTRLLNDDGGFTHQIEHGGLEDYIACRKLGATHSEIQDSQDTLRDLHSKLLAKHQDTAKQLGTVFPRQDSLFTHHNKISERSWQRVNYSEDDTPFFAETFRSPTITDTSSFKDLERSGIDLREHQVDVNPESVFAEGGIGKDNSLPQDEGYSDIPTGFAEREKERDNPERTTLDLESMRGGESPELAVLPSFERSLSAAEARSVSNTNIFYHPLGLYKTFRAIPGSTHQEFKDALESCQNKWQGLSSQFQHTLTIPHLLTAFAHLRYSGASQDEAKQFIQNTPEPFLKVLKDHILSIPFAEIKEASTRGQSIGGPQGFNGLKNYLASRIAEGKRHAESIKSSFPSVPSNPTVTQPGVVKPTITPNDVLNQFRKL